MHFGANEVAIGGGKYMVSKEQLAQIRQEIFYNNKEFKKLLSDKNFVSTYKTLGGEKSKLLPPDYKDFAKEQPLIANKQFWYWADLTRKDALSDKIDTILLQHMKAGLKINKFLWEAIQGH
jgi:hypothetical protein